MSPKESCLLHSALQEMCKGLTNSSCISKCRVIGFYLEVNLQGNEVVKLKNQHTDHCPCSTLPIEPEVFESLCFSVSILALRTASAASCIMPVKISLYFVTELLLKFIMRCCSFHFSCSNVVVVKLYSHLIRI